MSLSYIFHYPETNGTDADMLDSGPLDEVGRQVEKAGFHGLSLTEHPAPGARWLAHGGHQALDPLVAFAYVAAATERLKLLTYLALAPYRNPFLLAKSAATLDKLSNGRLILGLGTGYQKSEFFALGVDINERAALFDEALECLPLHWKGEPFSYEGLHFQARDIIARPKPVQDPIPIWIGGNSARARRRVAEKAQGWMPMMAPPEVARTAQTPAMTTLEEVAAAMREIREQAAAAGRTDQIDLLSSYHDPSIVDPTKDADRHREYFAGLEEAGVNWVVISHPRGEPAQIFDFVQAFGATYLA